MISAVIFDLDGTLTRTPSPWQHIHERIGVWDDRACHHFDAWRSGRLTYDDFCRSDVGLWWGRPLDEIHGYLDEIELNRHVSEVAGTLMRRGIPAIIISSGFTYVARRVQREFSWSPLLIYANELVDGPDVRICVSADPRSPLSKKAHADAALHKMGAALSDTLVVSDGLHDLEQLCNCGFHLHVREEDDLRRTLEFLD